MDLTLVAVVVCAFGLYTMPQSTIQSSFSFVKSCCQLVIIWATSWTACAADSATGGDENVVGTSHGQCAKSHTGLGRGFEDIVGPGQRGMCFGWSP